MMQRLEIIQVIKDLYLYGDMEVEARFPMPWDTKKSANENEQTINDIFVELKRLAIEGGFVIRVKPNFYRIQQQQGVESHDPDFRVWDDWDNFPLDKRFAADIFLIHIIDNQNFLRFLKTFNHEHQSDTFEATNDQKVQFFLQGNTLVRFTNNKEEVVATLRDGLLPQRVLHYIFSKPKGRVISIRELQSVDALNLTSVSSFTNVLRSLKLSEEVRSQMFEVLSRCEVQLRK